MDNCEWWNDSLAMELIDRFADRSLLDGVLRDVRSGQSREIV